MHFYYSSAQGGAGVSPAWNIFETRDGSNQSTRQWVWGTRYTDEILFMDVNGDPTADDDCDPDTTTGPESAETPADHRNFYHQDRNWNAVAITDHDKTAGASPNGRVVERYSYTPYGEFVVHKGYASGNEAGAVGLTSTIGNPFGHQGLLYDTEIASLLVRQRIAPLTLHRFASRDPLLDIDGHNYYLMTRNNPLAFVDPDGLCCRVTLESTDINRTRYLPPDQRPHHARLKIEPCCIPEPIYLNYGGSDACGNPIPRSDVPWGPLGPRSGSCWDPEPGDTTHSSTTGDNSLCMCAMAFTSIGFSNPYNPTHGPNSNSAISYVIQHCGLGLTLALPEDRLPWWTPPTPLSPDSPLPPYPRQF